MADIKRLLRKKSWTGRELGILELTNTAVLFRQSITGQPHQPIIDRAQFQQMINNITDRQQGRVYNGYIAIHEWLSLYYNIAQTNFQQAQLRYKSLADYIIQAELAEDVFQYIESLPVIMTQKQYEEAVEHGRELWMKEEDGTDRSYSVLAIIYKAIEYYAKLLTTEPKKPNPLKPIRKKYLAAPVKSELIRSRYNEATDNGYYTLEDGRRSDEMTDEEWQAAITTPKMQKALEEMRSEGDGRTARELAGRRLVDRARIIYHGGTERDAEKAQQRKDYEAGLAVPYKWHLYEEAPADLTKWEVLEDGLTCYEIYRCALGGQGEAPEDYLNEARDFIAEFREAVDAVIADIDRRYFKGEAGLASLPLEKWETTVYSWTELYEKDFYGFREWVNDDWIIWNGNWRAIANGVAILKPTNALDHTRGIDERGYYSPPAIRNSFISHSLESFFPEAEDYAENVDEVETGREALLDSYYFLKGYNTAIDLIAAYFDVPELEVFKMDIEGIEEKIDAINELVPVLYVQIRDTHYEDEELKQRKLQVLQDIFPEMDYKSLTLPADAKERVTALFEDFQAFRETETIAELLMYRPHPDEGEDEDEGGEC